MAAATALCSGIAYPALSQSQAPAADPYVNIDENGVDLSTGRYYLDIVEGAIGSGEGELVSVRSIGRYSQSDNWTGSLKLSGSGSGQTAYISLGKSSEQFARSGSAWISTKANGGTLQDVGGGWLYTSRAGAKVTFIRPSSMIPDPSSSPTQYSGTECGNDGTTCGLLTKVVRPSGVEFTLAWDIPQRCFRDGSPVLPGTGGGLGGGLGGEQGGQVECYVPYRLSSVTSSSSYEIDFDYADDVDTRYAGFPFQAFWDRESSTFSNLAEDPASYDPLVVTYERPAYGDFKITNSQVGSWTVTRQNGDLSIRKPGRSADSLFVDFDSHGRVVSVADDGDISTYNWASIGGDTILDRGPDGQVVTDPDIGRPIEVEDAAGNRVQNFYDGSKRLIKTIFPEGNAVEYQRDARGNITQTTIRGKDGVSILTSSASFPASCTNAASCNEPNYVIDRKGNRTDYTYGAMHGFVTQVQQPAPAPGLPRPTTHYEYAQFTAKRRMGSLYVPFGNPVWKVVKVRTCTTAETCAGSSDERVTMIAYDNPNLKPSSITVTNGTGSISSTTTYTYDFASRLETEDGPLPGDDDVTYYFYDVRGRRVGMIGSDPDGTGPMKRAAARFTYSENNDLLTAESGVVTDTNQAAVTSMVADQSVQNTYDSAGNRTVQKVLAGGQVYQLVQFSYDVQKRLSCEAIRMNPAVWTSLPASACTLGPQGPSGPDRITRYHYDGDDRVIRIESGVGTSAVGNDVVKSFTNNGRTASLTDGEGNKTSYIYDTFDRLRRTVYPDDSTAGISNSADYEELSYDASSNIIARRLRDGQVIGYGYDALDRLIFKDLPGSEPDATYGYDMVGQLVSAVQNGQTLSFAYDGIGRNKAQTGPFGAISYQYDAAGRRTRTTWPDAFYVTYSYLVDGRISTIRENGVTALASYGYNAKGDPTGIAFANGTTQSVVLDPLGRLSSLGIDLAGASSDNTRGFGYNPAGQIEQTTQSNDLYAFTALGEFDRTESVNGLNQITQAGTTMIAYDARGNLTQSGSDVFSYSSENQLTSYAYSGGSGTLSYDPLGRLYRYTAPQADTRFAYDGVDMIGEYNASNQLERRYVHGPGLVRGR